MTLISAFSLALALFVLAVTPGPGVFATISQSLSFGFKRSLALIAGIITGDLIFLVFAIYGLSYVAQAMAGLFTFIKVAGSIYLIYLGIKLWKSDHEGSINGQSGFQKGASPYFSGLVITLSNPKVILFYCSFLPAFMDLRSLNGLDILGVMMLVSIVLSGVLVVYAYVAGRAKKALVERGRVKRLNQTAGGLMMATGVTLAAQS